ncbi:MAG TPA: hypothetical protein VEI97_04675, partial [bacterium]|nr:hypothetical protein [bacterium]
GHLIHGWRRTLGDDTFFAMLKGFVREFGGKSASLADLTGAYYDALAKQGKVRGATRDEWVRTYSAQWYDQRGLPYLVVDHATAARSGSDYAVEGMVRVQEFNGPLTTPLRVVAYTGDVLGTDPLYDEWVPFQHDTLTARFTVPDRPQWVEFDPGYDQLRWIPDSEKVPSFRFLRFAGPTVGVVSQAVQDVLQQEEFIVAGLGGPAPMEWRRPEDVRGDGMAGKNRLAVGTLEDREWIEELLGPVMSTPAMADFDWDLSEATSMFMAAKDPNDPVTAYAVAYGRTVDDLKILLGKLPFYAQDSLVVVQDKTVTDHRRIDPGIRSLRARVTIQE